MLYDGRKKTGMTVDEALATLEYFDTV